MKVRDVIAKVIGGTGLTPMPVNRTCDRLIAGSPDQEVTCIGSTFMATVDVIRRAIDAGVDMIITHEPTWFTGGDETEWAEDDPVWLAKKELIDRSGIAIWRFHDHMHMCREDGIFRGFDLETGWREYRMKQEPGDGSVLKGISFDGCYRIPPTTLKGLADFLQKTFRMTDMRYIGNPDMRVERVGVLPGGGSLGLGVEYMPMQLMNRRNLDVIICGDLTEWTLPAYVRDASQMGMNKGIVVLGHERSEEPGMKFLGDWMSCFLPEIPVLFLDAEEPFGTFHCEIGE
ncbi:MAG: Nif3-like dinuclear metal center hexameric protein [Clostridia bacterium]|nr:Nif3-like dinuclear metal center hexameric protein [Clostridia bacterium]